MSNATGDGALLLGGLGSYEAILFHRGNGTVDLHYYHDEGKLAWCQTTTDLGRTWSVPRPVRTRSGEQVRGRHFGIVRLKSGRLAMIHGQPPSPRRHRDFPSVIRTSDDEGETWSEATYLHPDPAVMRSGTARVLSTGRLLVPVFDWVGPLAGPESEENGRSICFSWVFYSDDEGATWRRSESELVVMTAPYNALGCHDFEEPCVEELTDGRLLMHGRTRLGRHYQSISTDQGVTWSMPTPTDLAASYTPPHLSRIPSTGDLLAIWNQASPEEIWAGLHRHRLTCAISQDEGKSWQHHRNLESLDDATIVDPPPFAVYDPDVAGRGYGYHQPKDRARYHRAPGVLRICYPSVAFVEDQVMIAYDHGDGTLENQRTKLRTLPVGWFYDKS